MAGKLNNRKRYIVPRERALKATKRYLDGLFQYESASYKIDRGNQIDNNKSSMLLIFAKKLEIMALRFVLLSQFILQSSYFISNSNLDICNFAFKLMILSEFISGVTSEYVINCKRPGTNFRWAYENVILKIFEERENWSCRVLGWKWRCYDSKLVGGKKKALDKYFSNSRDKNADYTKFLEETNPVAWDFYCNDHGDICNGSRDANFFSSSSTYRMLFPDGRAGCPKWPNLSLSSVERFVQKNYKGNLTQAIDSVKSRKPRSSDKYDDNNYSDLIQFSNISHEDIKGVFFNAFKERALKNDDFVLISTGELITTCLSVYGFLRLFECGAKFLMGFLIKRNMDQGNVYDKVFTDGDINDSQEQSLDRKVEERQPNNSIRLEKGGRDCWSTLKSSFMG